MSVTEPLSRRRFLAAMGSLAGVAALGPLSGCSGSGSASNYGSATTAGLRPTDPTGRSGARGSTVKVSTWPVYVDKALLPVLEAKAGITLDYIEDYNDNSMARCSDCGTDMGRWGDFKAAAEKLKPQATSTPFKGFTR